MSEQKVGGIVYQVSMDIKPLLQGEKEVSKSLEEMNNSTKKTTEALNKLDRTAANVGSSLKMPEVNKLSRKMSELAGSIGAQSAKTEKATQVNNRFAGVLSTVSGTFGAGYVSNVGSATSQLVQHTKAAILATQAELEHAKSAQKEAEALQAAASQQVLNAKAAKEEAQSKLASVSAEKSTITEIERSTDAKMKDLEALRQRQILMVKDAEENYQMTASEKNLMAVTKAKNALYATENKIKTQLSVTGKEIAAIEARIAAAKEAEALATKRLNAAIVLEQKGKATLKSANEAVAAASAKVTLATQAQSVAMNGLKSAMALLGGPTGLFMLAAAGVYALYQSMSNNSSIDDYKSKIDEAINKLDELNAKQAAAAATKAESVIKANTKEIDLLAEKISYTRAQIKNMKDDPIKWQESNALKDYNATIDELQRKLKTLQGNQADLENESKRYSRSLELLNKTEKERTGKTDEQIEANALYLKSVGGVREANELLLRTLELGSPVIADIETQIDNLAKSLEDAKVPPEEAEIAISNLRTALEAKLSNNFEVMLQDLENNVTALKIEMKDGKDAAIEYRASVMAAKMGMTDEGQVKRYIQLIKEETEAREKLTNQNKKSKSGNNEAKRINDAIKKQQQQTEALRKEFELLSSGAANVNREMAIFNAVQSLGADATDKQKKAIAKEAAEVFDLKQKVDDFIKSQEITPELKLARAFRQESEELKHMFDNDFIDEETFKALGNKAMKAFDAGMAEIKINAVIDPITEAKGQYDPIQALANEHAKKLEMIRQFETEKGAITQRGLELMNAANTQYEQERLNAQWEIWRNQSQANQFLADGLDALGQRSTNVLTGLLTQTQSLNDAFRNVALTIVDQAVGALVQMGMQQVKNMVTESAMRKASNAQAIADATTTGAAITNAMAPAAATTSIATMGSAATWGMAAMATAIPAMIALAGARKNGGPVNAGSMYRVGEGGKPEIFKASNGSQYMIPGDNGRVISNRQMGKGGNGVSMGDMHFTFQVQAPNGITQKEAQQIQQMVRGTVYDVLGNEMRSGGALEKVRGW
ncbi:TPA: tape measure protein [Proteus mirabilis]|uniref:tape measure protein n=1 Tax=Proteus mirabilis TaxID=584 RepID=UPI001B9D0016|nr:tape measure protein [Proteus mirabilis]MDM3707391.1 tape measure protein [Proteus mirabilis]MDM3719189.1 tape measure protein [Proteus mirabilis]HBC7491266.1 tape measure protein [Proteus mirabilis]HCR4048358.1 tape measure protein [Proteus mirabilis]HCT9033535.1 tape measure protein [Proteus mirabilis]